MRHESLVIVDNGSDICDMVLASSPKHSERIVAVKEWTITGPGRNNPQRNRRVIVLSLW